MELRGNNNRPPHHAHHHYHLLDYLIYCLDDSLSPSFLSHDSEAVEITPQKTIGMIIKAMSSSSSPRLVITHSALIYFIDKW
jgi:hypothetical protein